MMTLRQVEVIRAVMVTGTIGGAARLLNVSAPGISRLVKYTERSLGIRFFQRQNGRYFPTPEAQSIFEQINGVYKKVDDLTEIISKIGHGALSELRVGSVPSISPSWCPRHRAGAPALPGAAHRHQHPQDRGGRRLPLARPRPVRGHELSARPLRPRLPAAASGELYCIVPLGHELAGRKQISAAEIIRYPLIGIDPNDPYGRIMARSSPQNLSYDISIRARSCTTVCALVKAGLGIAVIDEFTVAHGGYPGVELLRIVSRPSSIPTSPSNTARRCRFTSNIHRLPAVGNADRRAFAKRRQEARAAAPKEKLT